MKPAHHTSFELRAESSNCSHLTDRTGLAAETAGGSTKTILVARSGEVTLVKGLPKLSGFAAQ